MALRWKILAILFLARMAMAFQFQSVAAIGPRVSAQFGLDLSDIGLLIGLYLAPGVIVAIPGGAISARFGDRRVAAAGLVLMLLGGALMIGGDGWTALVLGRLLSGTGGVIINIVMTKMVVDWFAGREISTAMAIFINSWPVGIALALLILPWIAAAGGVAAVWGAVLLLAGLSLVLFLLVYRAPEGASSAVPRLAVMTLPVLPLLLASVVWAFYNAALSMVFSFGPTLLSARGWSLAAGGSATSLFMLLIAVAIPLGGVLADRTGKGDLIIHLSLLSFVLLMPFVALVPAPAVPAILLVVGLVFGLGAGPIVALPSAVLPVEARSFGMGVFYAIYYGVMMVAPRIAGALADRTGEIGVAFLLGAVLSVVSMGALFLFGRIARTRGVAG